MVVILMDVHLIRSFLGGSESLVPFRKLTCHLKRGPFLSKGKASLSSNLHNLQGICMDCGGVIWEVLVEDLFQLLRWTSTCCKQAL